MALRDVLQDILDELARREAGQGFDATHLEGLITQLGPREIAPLVPHDWTIKGRIGVGIPADVPWVGMFSPEGGSRAKEGLYLVYLFAKDGSAVYLSLNQGTEELAQPEAALRKRVLDIRTTVGHQPDLEVEPALKSDNLRPKKYGWGSAFANRYESTSIPDDQTLLADLKRMTELLQLTFASGLSFNPEIEPVHLLFKWNSDVELRTIELHREVADREGSVWWGRFAGQGAPKVSSQRIAQLNTQLAAGIPTYAFLYRRGETWRAEIIAAQDDNPEASDSRFPSYYKPDDCNFFVLLRNFEPLTPSWPTEHLLMASNPDPSTLSGALSNQTTPLFVFERFTTGQGTARPADNVWLEIRDKCRAYMDLNEPILTLDREVPNYVIGVENSLILRRSDEERGGGAGPSKGMIQRIWQGLLEDGEIRADKELRFAYALVGRLIDGVGVKHDPLRLYFEDRDEAMISWPRTETATTHWLFQANPKQWNLAEKLPTMQVGDPDTWLVTSYRTEIGVDDLIVLWQAGPQAGVYGFGRITGEPYLTKRPAWRPDGVGKDEEWFVPYVLTNILEQPLYRRDLLNHPILKNLAVIKFANATNFRVTEEEWNAMASIVGEIGVLPPPPPFDIDLVNEAALAKHLLIDSNVVGAIVAALNSGKHVVLTGPPGTAKTTLAEAVAKAANRAALNDGHTLTTATSDWTTFETIGGLRPTPTNQLEFAKGQFLQAISDNHWLVVDEMNRSNFDRAFGQLFTVLSGQSVVLPYEDPVTHKPIKLTSGSTGVEHAFHLVSVPEEWRMIATMNVFDKSLLFEMSFALMRRFAFIEVPAPDQSVYEQLIMRESGEESAEHVLELLRPLFSLRSLKELGPALFMDMSRFARERLSMGEIDDGDLRFQLFYSYLLPQFEGINDLQAKELLKIMKPLVGTSGKDKLPATLQDVLGVDLGLKAKLVEILEDLDENSL